MGKRIVILNGSPRGEGNTVQLIRAFTAGAEEAGHTVARFDLSRMKIPPCPGRFGVMAPGDIAGRPELEEARRLGASLS